MESLAITLSRVPGVVAVALGGSRARGTQRDDSDWDFALYYRNRLDVTAIRALGFPGEVFAPGDWAEPMHGGAWLEVDGVKVDLLYRQLARVESEVERARRGAFDICRVPGYLVGMPTYVLVGELAVGRVLVGSLPRPSFPAALRSEAARRWTWEADFWSRTAGEHRRHEDARAEAAAQTAADLAAAHARAAAEGRWTLNEKGLLAIGRRPSRAMEARDVALALDHLGRAGVDVWVDGGWGVDALVGRQTRSHEDLDLVLDRGGLAAAQSALAALGFVPDASARQAMPARAVLRDDRGRMIDLHPVLFDRAGNGWQQLSETGRRWGRYTAEDLGARGVIAGRHVRCLSAELQFRFRLGYEWTAKDEHDLGLLSHRFGVGPLPPV
jgi:predicted nucleotidyltransferase